MWLLGWGWPRVFLWVPAGMLAAGLGAVSATMYALLAGLTLPTQRALTMVLVLLAGLLLRRFWSLSHSLAVALVAVLLLDPLAGLSPGFWLSFGAVALIGLMVGRRLKREGMITTALRIQLGLALGLLPLTASLFGMAFWVAPLANLLAVPLVSLVVVPLILCGLLGLWLHESIAVLCWQLAASVLQGLMTVLDGLASWQHAVVYLPERPWGWTLLALAGMAVLLLPRGWPGRWLGMPLLATVLLWRPAAVPEGGFRLTVLDVGQGLASVVQTANHTLVFDAGPGRPEGFDAGASVLLPWLRAQGLAQVDTLLISHADQDHSGGAAALLNTLPVARVVAAEAGLLAVREAAPCTDQASWSWEGVQFRVLQAQSDFGKSSRNNRSCLLQVTNQAHRVLLTADIERAAEYSLVREYGEGLQAEVLLVPHHGSKTSSSPPFLKRVQPQLALVASGYRNRFGHPHPEVMQRYQDWGIAVLGTVENGALTLEFSADEAGAPVVARYREQVRRFWHQ
ncbi:MAG: DNA internalization-related competence protein ComEC/Rec2 [Thiolinea sp.]